jgi:hypothetical protein
MDVRELFTRISDADFNRERTLVMRDVVSEIHGKLRDYKDLSPITISYVPSRSVAEDMLRLACVRQLTDSKIIYWNPDDNDNDNDNTGDANYTDYIITVVNRYKLEELYTQLTDVAKGGKREQLPNLVYYNALSGRGLVNGNAINLQPKGRHKSKEIFDALFASAPHSVTRKKLIAILRLGNDSDATRSINEAINNLRKRCQVKSDVIGLQDSAVLNAQVIPFDNVPDFYIFPD